MHADIVDSTRLARIDESLAHQRFQNAFRELSNIINQHEGVAHEIRGDALVAEFARASDAVTAAVAFQSANMACNDKFSDDLRPCLRIGIAMGEVIVADNTVTGDGIVLAQRLEQLADVSGICVQGAVYETIPRRLPFQFDNLGERDLKGFDEPVRVYAVSQTSSRPAANGHPTPHHDPVDRPSIAVLPLENMSGDSDQEFFADGMSEDIISSLSRYGSLLVIARNSSFVYKGLARDIKQIGEELGVRYVMEGSIRRSNSRIRISVQLIDTSTGAHLWAQRYDREIEDVFDLQDEITRTIVAEILPELEAAERNRAFRKPSTSLSSWENYQRGMWHGYKLNQEGTACAEDCFQLVLNEDPGYQPAIAGLAWTTYLRVIFNFKPSPPCTRQELIDLGLEYAKSAVSADDDDALAQYAYGRLLALNGDFDESIDRLKYAIEINPNYALAYHGLGYTLSLGGRCEEALAQYDSALRLSPKDPYRFAFSTMRAFSLLQMRDYEGAIKWGRRGMRENESSFWAYAHVMSALGHLGRFKEAAKAYSDLLSLVPGFSSATIDETIRFKIKSEREHYLAGLYKAGLDH